MMRSLKPNTERTIPLVDIFLNRAGAVLLLLNESSAAWATGHWYAPLPLYWNIKVGSSGCCKETIRTWFFTSFSLSNNCHCTLPSILLMYHPTH